MRIAAVADLHGNLPPVPVCDVLVVAGDVCGGPAHDGKRWRPDVSDYAEFGWFLTSFLPWTRGAPYTVVVAGNHDTCLVGKEVSYPNLSYLLDSGCEHLGVKFWGTPWTKQYDGLAYNLPDEHLQRAFDAIPEGIDVLVSHSPPYGSSDCLLGSRSLRYAVAAKRPKLVLCGHIHESFGLSVLGSTKVLNCSGRFVEVEV